MIFTFCKFSKDKQKSFVLVFDETQCDLGKRKGGFMNGR